MNGGAAAECGFHDGRSCVGRVGAPRQSERMPPVTRKAEGNAEERPKFGPFHMALTMSCIGWLEKAEKSPYPTPCSLEYPLASAGFHPASAPSRGRNTSTLSGQHCAASLECVALQSPPGQAESAPTRSISAKNSMKSPGRTGLAFMKYWWVSRVKPVHMKTLSTSCT